MFSLEWLYGTIVAIGFGLLIGNISAKAFFNLITNWQTVFLVSFFQFIALGALAFSLYLKT